jgi:hypothetical protein
MIHADQIHSDPCRSQPSTRLTETPQMLLGIGVGNAEQSSVARPGELDISASQVLVEFASALGIAGALMYAVIRLWLFAP